MKVVIVCALLIAAAPVSLACGPELDTALKQAAAEEARQQRLLDNLTDFLIWAEMDYEAGNMPEADFELEMREGEIEFAAAGASLKAAADTHTALKARLAACQDTSQPVSPERPS